MPAIDIKPDALYFGIGKPQDGSPRDHANALTTAWFANAQGTEDPSTALATLIGRTKKEQFQLSPTDAMVQQFVSRYENFLVDFSDALNYQDQEAKIVAAQMNQRLAQSFYKLNVGLGHFAEKKSADFFMQTMKLLDQQGVALGTESAVYIAGAKAQAALMHFFRERKCDVLVPDPGNPAEVALWDAENHTDLAVVINAPNNTKGVFLIDAKGRNSFSTEGLTEVWYNEHVNKRSGQIVARQAVDSLGKRNVGIAFCVPLVIRIPTDRHYIGDYGLITDNVLKQSIMSGIQDVANHLPQ